MGLDILFLCCPCLSEAVQISVDAIAMGELNDIKGLVLHLVAVLQIAAFGGGNSEISSPQMVKH